MASTAALVPQTDGLVVEGGGLPVPQNSYVGVWKDSTGVAIGSRWVVSAGHVGGGAGTTFIMDGVTYTAKAVYPAAPGTDLMLIELNETLPGWHLVADSISAGTRVDVCGFGLRAGDAIPLGYLWSNQKGETWGSNIIDYANGTHLSMRFDRPDQGGVPGECSAATFDSGGGMFVRTESGALRLAGVITSVSGSAGSTAYGTRTYAVNLTTQEGFIDAIIGDPCQGDANGDGVVGSADITLVLSLWGQAVEPFTPGDGTGDGFVDFGDILATLSNWGYVCD